MNKFNVKHNILFPVLLINLILVGCEEQGLNPNKISEPGFGGTISYISKIPVDSLHDLRIVAVPYFPVDTTFEEVLAKIINRVIAYSENIMSTADSGKSVEYKLFVKPQTYFYVAMVQQYGSNELHDWKVVSVYGYSASTLSPKSVVVRDDEFTQGINFIVDFYNLPPQPF